MLSIPQRGLRDSHELTHSEKFTLRDRQLWSDFLKSHLGPRAGLKRKSVSPGSQGHAETEITHGLQERVWAGVKWKTWPVIRFPSHAPLQSSKKHMIKSPKPSSPFQPQLGLVSLLISLQSPLPSCTGHHSEAQVQGGAGEDRIPAALGKEAASTWKEKEQGRSYMLPSPAATASARAASRHSIVFIIVILAGNSLYLLCSSVPPSFFWGSLAQREKSFLQ